MRLIDADKFIESCKEIIADFWNQTAGPSSWARAYEDVIDEIEEQPVIDAVPRKAAEWLERKGGMKYECSECNGKVFYKTKYCPNCGAEMEKEIENEKSNS